MLLPLASGGQYAGRQQTCTVSSTTRNQIIPDASKNDLFEQIPLVFLDGG
jgi:hypothetical protein